MIERTLRGRQRPAARRLGSTSTCLWLEGARKAGEADPAPGMEECPAEVLGSAVKVTLAGQPHLEDYFVEK